MSAKGKGTKKGVSAFIDAAVDTTKKGKPKAKTNGKPKDFTSYDTPKVKETLEDMGKPPSQRKVDATGTKRKKPVVATKTKGRPKIPVTTPPVKKGKMGKIAKGMAITSPAWLGPPAYVAYKEMKRPKSHKVTSGQNLSSIAKKYGTTIKAIMKANPSIKNANLIRIGQNIKLPFFGRGKDPYKGMSKSEMAKLHKETQARKAKRVSKKQTGGRMSRIGLSPAEMARAGTMSEAKRKRYVKGGGKVGKKKGGTVNRKHGGQIGTAYIANLYD